MRTFGKFAVKVLVAICVLVCSRAALEVAHALGWHPELQLANLILTAPSALQIELVMWSILAFVTAALWLLIDYYVYGRNYAALCQAIRKKLRSPKDRPPVTTVMPGIVWKKLKNDDWRAEWRASPEAKKLGFKPHKLQVFQGCVITQFDEEWISDRARDMQTEMDQWLRSKQR